MIIMPIDPSISLQGTPVQIPGPIDSAGKMLTLKHLISQDQMNQLQMQEAQLKLQGEQDVRNWASKPENVQGLGLSPSLSGLASTNPAQAFAFQKLGVEAKTAAANQEKLNLENMMSKADILGREMAPLLKQKEILPEHIVSTLQNLSRKEFDISKVELPKDTNPDTLRAWAQHGVDSSVSMKEQANNALTKRGQDVTAQGQHVVTPYTKPDGTLGYKYVPTSTATTQGLEAPVPLGAPNSAQSINIRRDNYVGELKPLNDMSLTTRQLKDLLMQPQNAERDLAIRNMISNLVSNRKEAASKVAMWKNVGGIPEKITGTLSQLASGEMTNTQVQGIANLVKMYENTVINPLIKQTNQFHADSARRANVNPEDVVGGWQSNPVGSSDLTQPTKANRPPLSAFQK